MQAILLTFFSLAVSAIAQPFTLNDHAIFGEPVTQWVDTSNMVARWRFNGSLVDDVSACTLYAAIGASYTNTALRCEQSNRYSLGSATAIANALRGSNWTVSLWCSFDRLNASNFVFGICEDTFSADLLGVYVKSDRIDVIGDSSNLFEFYPTPGFTSNTVYNIVVSRSGTSISAKVNATAAPPALTTGTWTTGGTDNLSIGQHYYGSAQPFFTGWIDDLSIWARTLSSTEITTIYSIGRQ